MGDRLIVGLSTDDFNVLKNKTCIQPYDIRKKALEECGLVDEIFEENSWEQKIDDVKNKSVDVFVIGDDWEGKFDFLKEYCEVVYLPRTPDISTTELKEFLKKKGKL